jgi:hypothetical protein
MAPGLNNLTFNGLIPGQNYFLMIDGFAGAICIDHQGNIAHLDSFPTMVYASYDGLELDVFE